MFIKECKAIAKSIIYFAFIAVVILFYVTQLGDYAGNDIKQYATLKAESGEPPAGNPLIAPIPGQASYGYRNAEIPQQVMPNAIAHLAADYAENGFTSYSTGFYRNIKLSEKQLLEIDGMLIQMTGLTADELNIIREEKIISESKSGLMFDMNIDYSRVIPVNVSYDEFKANMKYINRMIGGGSYYDPAGLKQYGRAEVSYEERLAEHNDFLNTDKITGAYARLFCDYMGITIALFSVFVPVSFLLRDKRAKMDELIYSRGKSSVGFVLSRYFSLVCMTILPVLLLSFIPTLQLSLFAAQNGMSADYTAFVKYIGAWLLPTALTTTAVAYFFTTLTDTPIAILLQLVWSLYGIFTGVNSLEGGRYGIEIAIRHNSLGNLHLVRENMNALIANRALYTAASIFLILIAVYLYDLKRRGRLNVFNGFKKSARNR